MPPCSLILLESCYRDIIDYYYCVPTIILVAPAGIKLAGTEAITTPFDVINTLLVA